MDKLSRLDKSDWTPGMFRLYENPESEVEKIQTREQAQELIEGFRERGMTIRPKDEKGREIDLENLTDEAMVKAAREAMLWMVKSLKAAETLH